jgi:hypothetical protein
MCLRPAPVGDGPLPTAAGCESRLSVMGKPRSRSPDPEDDEEGGKALDTFPAYLLA